MNDLSNNAAKMLTRGGQTGYLRVICFVFGLAVIYLDRHGALGSDSDYILAIPKYIFLAVTVSILVYSFFESRSDRFTAQILFSYLAFTSAYVILLGYENNFSLPFGLAVGMIVLATNLHLPRVAYLIVYNALVIAAIEYLFILIPFGASGSDPLTFFTFLLLSMASGISFQLLLIRKHKKNSEFRNSTYSGQEKSNEADNELLRWKGSALQYRSYLEKSGEGIIVTTMHGVIKFCNNKAASMTGFSERGQLNNRNVGEVIGNTIAGTLIGKAGKNLFESQEWYVTKDESDTLATGTRIKVSKQTILTGKGNELVWILKEAEERDKPFTELKPEPDDDALYEHDINAPEVLTDTEPEIHEPDPPVIGPFNSGVLTIKENGSILKSDHKFQELCGYTEPELISMSLLSIIHPSDAGQFRNKMFGESGCEARIITRDGQTRWLRFMYMARGNDHLLVCNDISELHEARLALAEVSSNMNAVIENTGDPIVAIDFDHSIIVMNSAFVNMTGSHFGNKPRLGDSIWNSFGKSDRPEWMHSVKEALNGIRSTITERLAGDNDNKHRFIETSFHPIRNLSGIVTGVTILSSDITDRVRYESSLIEDKTIAEEEVKAKSVILATMSHEIRTPLNGLIGMAELLRNTRLNEEQQDFVNKIQISGETLLGIINNILDFSRMESERMELDHKSFVLSQPIEDTFNILFSRAKEKGNQLKYSIEHSVSDVITGDMERLRQVLLNLVGNAIKFTENGTITVSVTSSGIKGSREELQFAVKDTGIGIENEKLNSIFEAFSQADPSVAAEYGGTGLGLAICSKITELMGGRIWVESTPGQGSTFFFTILTEPGHLEQVSIKKSSSFRFDNQRILLFSNNRVVQSGIRNIAREWNAELDEVHEEEEFISQFKQAPYLIIFIDDENKRSSANKILGLKKLTAQLRKTNAVIAGIRYKKKSKGEPVTLNSDPFDMLLTGFPDAERLGQIISNIRKQGSAQAEDQSASVTQAEKLPHARILVAEDNEVNQSLIRVQLEQLGFKPDIVTDGKQAVSKTKLNSYDIILLDVQMPVMNGLDAARIISKRKPVKKQPVIIAMTAYDTEEDRQQCLEAGMMDVMTKPLRIEILRRTLERWINGSGQDTGIQLTDPGSVIRIKQMAEGDKEFISNLLKLYKEQSVPNIEEIVKANRKKNYKKLASSVHKLKGSSLNIGAKAIADQCVEIELLIRDERYSEIHDIVDGLDSIFNDTITELRKAYL